MVNFIFILSACKNANTSNKSENNDNENFQRVVVKTLYQSMFLETQFTQSDNLLNDLLLNVLPDSSMEWPIFRRGIYDMGSSNPNMALKENYLNIELKLTLFMDIHEVTNAQFSAFVAATIIKPLRNVKLIGKYSKNSSFKQLNQIQIFYNPDQVFFASKDIYN